MFSSEKSKCNRIWIIQIHTHTQIFTLAHTRPKQIAFYETIAIEQTNKQTKKRMANRKNRSQLKFNQMLNKIAFNRNAFRKFNFNCKSIDVKFRQKFVLELEEKNRSSLVWICCSRRWYNLRAELCWVRGLFVRMLLPLFSHSYTRKRWKCEWNSITITWWLPLHSIQRQQTQRQISNKLAHTLTHSLTNSHMCARVFRVFSSHFSVPIGAVCWLTRSCCCCCCHCYCPDVRDFNDRRIHNFSSSLCFFMYAQPKVAMTRCACSHSRQFYMYRWSD